MDFENSKSVLPPTFLEKGWGFRGKGKTLFSCEKKFFPSPE